MRKLFSMNKIIAYYEIIGWLMWLFLVFWSFLGSVSLLNLSQSQIFPLLVLWLIWFTFSVVAWLLLMRERKIWIIISVIIQCIQIPYLDFQGYNYSFMAWLQWIFIIVLKAKGIALSFWFQPGSYLVIGFPTWNELGNVLSFWINIAPIIVLSWLLWAFKKAW